MSKKLAKSPRDSLRRYLFIGVILFVFLIIRSAYLPETVKFGSDEGRDFLATWRIYANKELTLIGPPSEYKIDGREFFFGPAPYYVILPALIIGNWEPLAVSYLLIVVNAVAFLLILLMLDKYIRDKRVLYSFAVVTTFTPNLISYAQSYWNPHFMLPISLLLLALLIKNKYSNAIFLLLLIGFFFGLGLQFHYSFIFAILIGIIWLKVTQKFSFASFLCVFGGFIVGFLPLIVFELRNNFYNTSTFLWVFSNASRSLSGFTFHSFYFISIFPFLVLIVSFLFAKLNKLTAIISVSIFLIGSLAVIISVPKQELSYMRLQKLATLIEKDNPKNFNIVDQLTRDNRAMALRYLLTVHDTKPQEVTEYPQAETIYIYSKLPLASLLKEPVWEIKAFLSFKNATTTKVDEEIYLYKLEK